MRVLLLLAWLFLTYDGNEASRMKIISSPGCPVDPPPAAGQQCHDPEDGRIYTWTGTEKISMGLGIWRVAEYRTDDGQTIRFAA